jgi:hypothetical protein
MGFETIPRNRNIRAVDDSQINNIKRPDLFQA